MRVPGIISGFSWSLLGPPNNSALMILASCVSLVSASCTSVYVAQYTAVLGPRTVIPWHTRATRNVSQKREIFHQREGKKMETREKFSKVCKKFADEKIFKVSKAFSTWAKYFQVREKVSKWAKYFQSGRTILIENKNFYAG